MTNAGWKVAYSADVNRDGKADALWFNSSGNRFALWLMDGTQLLARGPVIPGPSGDGWEASKIADFSLDGMADVLWLNAKSNRMAVWLMDGSQVLAPGPEIPGPSGDGWNGITAADFNLDGMADVLWFNPRTNRMAVWLMNGSQLLAPGPEIPGPSGDGWDAITAADFNSDGMADVLWFNPRTNRMAVWLMNGSQLLAPGPDFPGPRGDGWVPIQSADFNFDGMADVHWHNPGTNRISVWLMNGVHVLAQGPEIPGPSGSGWICITDADFNDDGRADIIWQNAGLNLITVFLMNGVHLLAPGPWIPGLDDAAGR